jgi:hypothetical protein
MRTSNSSHGAAFAVLLRAAIAVVLFSLGLLGLALVIQELPLEPEYAFWALAYALPLGLAVLRGGLGWDSLAYPNVCCVVLVMWTVAMAPSFIIDHPDAHQTFIYSTQAVTTGRCLFLLWNLLFVLACGPAKRTALRVAPQTLDVLAISIPIAIALGYQVVSGRFSNYQGGPSAVPTIAGDTGSIAQSLATGTLLALPGFFVIVAARSRTSFLIWFARFAFVVFALLVFLSGGRSTLAVAVGVAFFLARALGLRFRLDVSVAAIVALPAVLFLVFTYRSALSATEGQVSSVSGFASVALESTQAVMSQDATRSRALTNFSENTKSRLWYAPQFYTVVDEWDDHGAALAGTFWEGIIRTIPTAVFADKNDIADNFGLELQLEKTNRFPEADLSPTPWMQWLYELGLLGIVAGSIGYGLFVRLLESRISKTSSIYEILIAASLVAYFSNPEHVSDGVLIAGRNAVSVLIVPYLATWIWKRIRPHASSESPHDSARPVIVTVAGASSRVR